MAIKNNNKAKSTEGIEIGEDFQGWPIYKRTWKWILDSLGFIFGEEKENSVTLTVDTSLLSKYPEILEDDGMGYSPTTKYITDVDTFVDSSRLWVDESEESRKKRQEFYKEKTSEHLYIKLDWPDVQEYMGKPWFMKNNYYDSRDNVWFVPAKFIK